MQFELQIADYGALGLRLIRRFDVHSKDPSLTRRILRAWEKQTSCLFRECNIFRIHRAAPQAPGLAPSQASEEPGPQESKSVCKTATHIAMEQIAYIADLSFEHLNEAFYVAF